MPDYQFRRPFLRDVPEAAFNQLLWIEFKKPGGKLTPAQNSWHEAALDRGDLVWIVGLEEDWWESFKARYDASGLRRMR